MCLNLNKEGTWQQQRKQNVQQKPSQGKHVITRQPENQNSVHLTRKNSGVIIMGKTTKIFLAIITILIILIILSLIK